MWLESLSILFSTVYTSSLWISCATVRDYCCKPPPLLPGGIVPSNLPELLMCVLQTRLWFHDSLIRSKLGLLQSLCPQLLPFPVPAVMLVWSHTELIQKTQLTWKNVTLSSPFHLPMESNKYQCWCKRLGWRYTWCKARLQHLWFGSA